MKLAAQDYIVVLGDMGLFWRNDRRDSKTFIEMFEQDYEFNLYFIDGN